MSWPKRLFEFLGLRRSIVGMLSMGILVGMGEHMGEQFLPRYLEVIGGTALLIGLLNGMDNLLGAIYSVPGGQLAEWLGVKRSLVVFNIMSIVGFLFVIFIQRPWAVIAGAALFLSWTAISMPATMGLIARVLPKTKRTMGVSVQSIVRRLPMAIGPVIGGVLIYRWGWVDGIRIAFAVAIALAVAALILQQVLIEPDTPGKGKGALGIRPMLALLPQMSPQLRRLLVADVLVRFCEQIPYPFVVIWSTTRIAHAVSAEQFGWLRTIEMATAILIYIPVAFLADRSHKKPFVVMTFVFFTAFPLMLLFSRSFELLIAAFILRGLKEFGEPTRKALIMDLAPEDHKAGMFGLYYLIRDTIVSLAAFGGGALWMISPATNFLTAFAFGAIGTIWFAFRGTDLQTQTPPTRA